MFARSPSYEVAVYYFPQYHVDPRNERWHGIGWTEWELTKRAEPRFVGHQQPIVPAWGHFNEADPLWAAHEIDLAAAHGITTFLYDWYWYDDQPFLHDALEQGFLKAPNNEDLKFALMWANHDWLNLYPTRFTNHPEVLTSGKISREDFGRMTDYIIEQYFGHPNYLTINGAPYISIFDLGQLIAGMGSLAETIAALDDWRAKVRHHGFPDLHINVIDQYLDEVPRPAVYPSWSRSQTTLRPAEDYLDALAVQQTLATCHIASIASYNWMPQYHWAGTPQPTVLYDEVAAANYQAWQQRRQQFNVPFLPNVMMGYDSTPRTTPSDTFMVNDYPWWPVIIDNSPDAFHAALQQAKQFADQGPPPPLITLNAWNEWTEGSYLLPDTQHGLAYLEAIRAVFPPQELIRVRNYSAEQGGTSMQLAMIDLQSATFHDKVRGCWLGKNCGGTLGAPLETPWGQPEPFDIWWYPQLQVGGIPNDDLEMQLIWLQALEDIGPHLRAADLAQYWLDHIGYNWDEYGMSKTNLRLGLVPPVSGAYNNWFKDCMGSPIRSEIWACVAPGAPDIAVRYAYQDAICDHAGGEGVFGELFNAAIESAAFALSDRETLLDIGLAYIPPWSATARAVNAARAAYHAGEDWLVARQRVLAATPHVVAQYTPINIGFQVIGWLYGQDFGDALCKAVNCGYDTDCTGATLGSILGIIAGAQALPDRWIAPLGDTITTNAAWGGLRHSAHLPTTIEVLTDRICALAPSVLAAHDRLPTAVQPSGDSALFLATAAVQDLWTASSMQVTVPVGSMIVTYDYGDSPVAVPGTTKIITADLFNPHPDPITVACELHLPHHWPGHADSRTLSVPPQATTTLAWHIPIPPAQSLQNSHTLLLSIQPTDRPAQLAVPIVLIGAQAYRLAGPYRQAKLSDRQMWEFAFPPEEFTSTALTPDARAGDWKTCYATDNALPLPEEMSTTGVYYVQTYLWSMEASDIWLGAAASCPTKLWCNGDLLNERFLSTPVRPYYGGTAAEGFAQAHLHEGWNEVLIKYLHIPTTLPFSAYLVYSTADVLHQGLPTIGRTQLPWDSGA